MKILACPDIHFRDNKPINRKDKSYVTTMAGKLGQIFGIATGNEVDVICMPGDIFNTYKANDFLKQTLARMIVDFGYYGNVVAVFGQHDLRYHSKDRSNIPLTVLDKAGVIEILDDAGYTESKYGEVDWYGSSWEEPIPMILRDDAFNVWVTHRMIINNEKLWDEQEDYELSNILLKTTGFDLIISGDNHHSFISQTSKGKCLINCGSLMRTNIDQGDHHPHVVVFDTDTRSYEVFKLKVEPFEDVMDMSVAVKKKEKDERMESFISTLKGTPTIAGLNYGVNVKKYVEKNKKSITQGAQDIITEVMSNV